MGFDLLTSFSPSKGGVTGTDDFYNVPGCMQLDGSQDTSVATRGIAAGTPAASFSAVPLISEIQSAFGWNQVIALVRRRIQLYNALTGGSHVLPAFVNSGDAPITKLTDHGLSSDSGSLHDAINTIRLGEGLPAYTFIAQFNNSIIRSRKDISGLQLAECRKALRISGLQTLDFTLNSLSLNSGTKCIVLRRYLRTDNPYGTPSAESIINPAAVSPYEVGKSTGTSPAINRERMLSQFAIPEWATSAPSSATYSWEGFSTDVTLETFILNFYSSNTDDRSLSLVPAFGGVAYHLDNLENNAFTNVDCNSVVRSFAFSTARIAPRANGYLCFIIGTQNEINGLGLGSSSNSKNSRTIQFFPSGAMVLNWGA